MRCRYLFVSTKNVARTLLGLFARQFIAKDVDCWVENISHGALQLSESNLDSALAGRRNACRMESCIDREEN